MIKWWGKPSFLRCERCRELRAELRELDIAVNAGLDRERKMLEVNQSVNRRLNHSDNLVRAIRDTLNGAGADSDRIAACLDIILRGGF